eukprot:GHVS01102117.1.p1 GENE.GHVS01102117.1~~GHVS01102117.1.p1  ORF type:complete len:233 (-),score=15.22 GHVS01102117.1:691-1389(-)
MSVMDGSIGNSQTSKKISETSTKEEYGSQCLYKMGHVRPGSAMYDVFSVNINSRYSYDGIRAWTKLEKYKIGVVMTDARHESIITLSALTKMDNFVESSTEEGIPAIVCRPKGSRVELTPFDVNILREYVPPLSVEQLPPLSDPQTVSSSKDIFNAGSRFMDNLVHVFAVIGLVCVLVFGAFFAAYLIAGLRHYLWASRRKAKSPKKRCGCGGERNNAKPGGVYKQDGKKDN